MTHIFCDPDHLFLFLFCQTVEFLNKLFQTIMMSSRLLFLEPIMSRIFGGSCYVKSQRAYFEQAPKFPGNKFGPSSESSRQLFFSLKSLAVQTLDVVINVGASPVAQKATDSIRGRPGYR